MISKKLKNLVETGFHKISRKAVTPNDRQLLDLGIYTKEWILPRNLTAQDSKTIIPSKLFDDRLELNISSQISLLNHWHSNNSLLFNNLRKDPTINTQFFGEPYLHNGFFPTPDAEIYASMIIDHMPSQIIEIGSGFSTLIARKCINFANLNTAIICIDPNPRTDIRKAASKLFLEYVEDLDISEIEILENTLLFIDSSHICRGLGDIPYLFCKLIPRIPSGVLVHVHDIFLPYEYPIGYLNRLYTEQYLLYSLLLDSNRYEIVFTSHYMTRKYPQEMQATFGSIVGMHNRFFGASFWFRVK